MQIKFLIKIFKKNANCNALIWHDKTYKYNCLLKKITYWKKYLKEKKIQPGFVIGLEGDFSPNTITILLCLIDMNCIIVPFDYSQRTKNQKKYKLAKLKYLIAIDTNDCVNFKEYNETSHYDYYNILRKNNRPGLVLFTSGSSGEPKAAVHDFSKLLDKFKTKRKPLSTLNFLLFDHWGGLNTMFHTLYNGGTVISVIDRKPDVVCKLIDKYNLELLPASPTFLNLMIISGAYQRWDLSSLKIISYGAEPMPESVLLHLNKLFPNVKLLQTYGLIELGVLRSKSKSNDSLWVKIGGEGYKVRVVNDMLQIKADSAILGYLNAPSPFTEDGWFITGDKVLQDGDYFKILGRESEIINVGGEKVYPAEVESVILEIDNVSEVRVYGQKNPIVGNIVCANVRLKKNVDHKLFISRLKKYCRQKIQNYKIPVKVKIDEKKQYSDRYKKKRV